MTHDEMNAILIEGVKRGNFVAYDVGSGVQFVGPRRVTLEIVRAALTAEELATRLRIAEAATG